MSVTDKIQQWLTPWLIKLKFVKQVALSLDELSDDLSGYLPYDFEFEVPNGQAKVKILKAVLTQDAKRKGFVKAQLMCKFDIRTMGEHIYSARLAVELFATPLFLKDKSVIRGADVEFGELRLSDENMVMVSRAKNILSRLSSNILGDIVSLTLGSALVAFDDITDAKGYISLFVNQSTQRILKIHRGDIEKNLLESFDNGDIQFRLEDCIFEEKIFATYGKDIIVQDNNIICRF